MEIEVKTREPYQVRLTLDANELYLLKVALERACYMDTAPEDQSAANAFAESMLGVLQGHDAGRD